MKIVDRNMELEKRVRRGKWRDIFRDLPSNKAVEFETDSRKEAHRIAVSIYHSARSGGYAKLHYAIIPRGSKYIAYIWKEEK